MIRVAIFAAFALAVACPAHAIDIYKHLADADRREQEDFLSRERQREYERWRRMTPEERIADELRRARLERERAREESVQRRLYDQGHLPGSWLYWFRYGR